MARKILVSLVGGQTIPNVEFIKEKADEADFYLFITTPTMEKEGQVECIVKSAGIPQERLLPTLVVNPFSFEDMEQKLDESEFVNDEDEYLVNITAGTKVMSISAYEYFKNLNAKLYYLTGAGKYIKLHPGLNKKYFHLKSKITLEEYLFACGFQITKKDEPFGDRKLCESFLDYYLNRFNQNLDAPVLDSLSSGRNKGISNLEKIDGLPSFLERIGYVPDRTGKLTKYECRFLTGEWFEDYVYFYLIEEFGFNDDEIGKGWIIEKNKIPNELDVLLIRNNKIYMIECKTSVFTGPRDSDNIVAQTIYKTDSLRSNLGLKAKAAIVTLSSLDSPSIQPHLKRAKGEDILIAGRKTFEEGTLKKFFEEL